MGAYTDYLERQTYDIFEHDDYISELYKVVEEFRPLDEALDFFIKKKGYFGKNNPREKSQFMLEKFKEAKINVPRNIYDWFERPIKLERKTIFQIAFAFNLSIEETVELLKMMFSFHRIDKHDIREIVYFFCLDKGLDYRTAEEILSMLPKTKKSNLPSEHKIVYTQAIDEALEQITSKEELIDYLTKNASVFEYNNATAHRIILDLWQAIAGENGYAMIERTKLYTPFDVISEKEYVENAFQNAIRKRAREEDSVWGILLQILGLSGRYMSYHDRERSIKELLKENRLIHPFAEESFPDRDGMNKILKGTHFSYERGRKILVLLLFYRYWVELAIKRDTYKAQNGDAIRFTAYANNHLYDAGYMELYPGNPFDFIVLFSINDEAPLQIFREYMQEVFWEKNGEICIQS